MALHSNALRLLFNSHHMKKPITAVGITSNGHGVNFLTRDVPRTGACRPYSRQSKPICPNEPTAGVTR